MIIKSYFGLKPCCDCGRTGNYTINKNGFQFTVCANCLQNYTDEEESDVTAIGIHFMAPPQEEE